MFEELVLVWFTEKMSEYRINRKREQQQNLERLAEDEAELEQLALDLEACSKYPGADVRLKTKLKLIEQEDYGEVKTYVDNLLKEREKKAQEKKERYKRRGKFAAKLAGITAVVISLGYGVPKVSSAIAMYEENYSAQRELEKQLENAANVDCFEGVRMNEFLIIYKEATGKEFPNPHLVGDKRVGFEIDPAINSIKIKSVYGSNPYYEITLPPKFVEQLILKKPTCSISLE